MSLSSTKFINPSPVTHQKPAPVNKIPAAKQTQLALKFGKSLTLSTHRSDRERWWGTRCVASSSSSASAAAMEIIVPEEVEELMQRREKCREKSNVPELLECLETEAIMGDDEGKDPKDYNRRAKIFDKSSRIFQALKAQESHK